MPQKILRSALIVFFVFYLAFHTINGDQGVYALWVQSHKMTMLKDQLAETRAERKGLEHRVALLRDTTLDPDLLDEQSRRFLGVSAPDEVIVYTNDTPSVTPVN